MVKNLPANAEDPRVMSSVPGLGRSRWSRECNPLRCSAREVTEEPDMLQSVELQTVGHNWATEYTNPSIFSFPLIRKQK